MKYIDADRLKDEIERRIKLYDGNNTQELWIGNTYRAVLSFLDTLSEEPDKSLEEEIKNYFQGYFPGTETVEQCNTDLHFTPPAILRLASHFAEWQKEQMLKDAEECELYWDGDFLAIDLNMVALGYSEKDKVKVIVLKEEE